MRRACRCRHSANCGGNHDRFRSEDPVTQGRAINLLSLTSGWPKQILAHSQHEFVPTAPKAPTDTFGLRCSLLIFAPDCQAMTGIATGRSLCLVQEPHCVSSVAWSVWRRFATRKHTRRRSRGLRIKMFLQQAQLHFLAACPQSSSQGGCRCHCRMRSISD
jgi:hypothetical protein